MKVKEVTLFKFLNMLLFEFVYSIIQSKLAIKVELLEVPGSPEE